MSRPRVALAVLAAGATLAGAGWLCAQSDGPVNGPLPPVAPIAPRPKAVAKPEPPPPIPPEQIIRRFAANEDAMLSASLAYSFLKSVRVDELGPDDKPTGSEEIVTQLAPWQDGKRTEKAVSRTPSTLRYLAVERGDLNFVDAAPLFPLTTSELPKYNINYEGLQPLDELSVYVFSVTPRSLDRAHAYFSGAVWVDKDDFVIVKTIGKWVTETGDVTSIDLPFTIFETYREQVSKNEWFPAYSRSDSFFDRGNTHVAIRMITRWSNYTSAGSAAPSDAGPSAAPAAAAPATEKPASNPPTGDAQATPNPQREH